MRYELVAVTRKAVYQKRIIPQEGLRIRDRLLAYPVTLHFDTTLLKRAYDLAAEYGLPTAYDAQYLALAESLECEFWTTDERMVNTIKDSPLTIHWLGGMNLEQGA